MMIDTGRTLATVWVCTLLSILIMLARLVLGRWCKKKFDVADLLTCVAIFFSVARIAFTHVIIIWGTANISPSLGEAGLLELGSERVREREMGGKFTLVARCLYILQLWIQKSVLLSFYAGMLKDISWGKKTVRPFWALLAATFIADIVVTFTGCHPFDHYWKVLPQTDRCTEAIVQLFIVGGTNILTDVLLIILPIPVLWGVRINWKKKAQLGFLFSVGFVIIAVTAVRLPRTLDNATSETNRITWTTGEFLAATFVANAPTLYSFRQRFRQKAPRVRQFSRSGPHIRHTPDFGGTTLTAVGGESTLDRSSNEIEEALQMSEHGEVGKERKPSLNRNIWSDGTNKSKG